MTERQKHDGEAKTGGSAHGMSTTEFQLDVEADRYLSDPRSRAEPWALFSALQRESPVHLTSHGVYLVTRYKDVRAMLAHPGFSRALEAERHPTVEPGRGRDVMHNTLLHTDDPAHGRMRSHVMRAFNGAAIRRWEARAQEIVDDRIDTARANGRIEFIREFAYPLSQGVTCELLGVPVEDHERFEKWIDDAIEVFPGGDVDAQRAAATQAMLSFADYLEDVVAERRRTPGDDFVTALIAAEDEDDTLSSIELMGIAYELVKAGTETTANTLGNGMFLLLANPDQYARLLERPELAGSAGDEMLRCDSPFQMTAPRLAREDIVLDGGVIPAGATAIAIAAAANRDPTVFENPQVFDITRKNNKYLTFGFGAHYCVGSLLAKAELRIAFETIARRLPPLRAEVELDDVQWREHHLIAHALETLPLTW